MEIKVVAWRKFTAEELKNSRLEPEKRKNAGFPGRWKREKPTGKAGIDFGRILSFCCLLAAWGFLFLGIRSLFFSRTADVQTIQYLPSPKSGMPEAEGWSRSFLEFILGCEKMEFTFSGKNVLWTGKIQKISPAISWVIREINRWAYCN